MRKSKSKVVWACPECGATALKHGVGGARECLDPTQEGKCGGFLCDCITPESDLDNHGTEENPCYNADCSHCGYAGSLPKLLPDEPEQEDAMSPREPTVEWWVETIENKRLGPFATQVEAWEALAEIYEPGSGRTHPHGAQVFPRRKK